MTNTAKDPTFNSLEEEVHYWKSLATEYQQSLDEAREELDEFQISSRELETELEAQLELAETKANDLGNQNTRLNIELDIVKEKLDYQETINHKHLSELEDELAQVKAFKDELQKYIRELEQSNDDLERTKRTTVVSLEDFESRLNLAIERNAFLESELEEKDSLAITVQRLKDEARDLRSELDVKSPTCETKKPSFDDYEHKHSATPTTVKDSKHIISPNSHIDSNKLADMSISEMKTPTSHKNLTHTNSNSTPLTPSARISALNIVGDLLRKVGTLESKLASCRNFVKDQPRSATKSSSGSPHNSPSDNTNTKPPRGHRAKRLHRSSGGGNFGSAPGSAHQKPNGGYGFKASV